MNSHHISTPFTCAAWCQDAIVQHVIPANLCCPTVKYVLLFCGHRMPFYQTFSVMYYLVNTFASLRKHFAFEETAKDPKIQSARQRKPKGRLSFSASSGGQETLAWLHHIAAKRRKSLSAWISCWQNHRESKSRCKYRRAYLDRICIQYICVCVYCSNCLYYIYVPPSWPPYLWVHILVCIDGNPWQNSRASALRWQKNKSFSLSLSLKCH